jgi:hypothetical protein
MIFVPGRAQKVQPPLAEGDALAGIASRAIFCNSMFDNKFRRRTPLLECGWQFPARVAELPGHAPKHGLEL